MADDTIHIPPFPALTWDEFFWTGEIKLPSWAGFQDRRGPHGSAIPSKQSDGTVRLTILTMDDARVPPTPVQAAACEYLMVNEAEVASAVGRGLVEYYQFIKKVLEDYDCEGMEDLPDVSEAGEMRSLVGLNSVNILAEARDGIAYVGFHFGCVWDEEHDSGIMTHLSRVIKAGEEGTASDVWIARSDAERATDPA